MPLARSAAELLTSGDCSRLRQCVGEECGRPAGQTVDLFSQHSGGACKGGELHRPDFPALDAGDGS